MSSGGSAVPSLAFSVLDEVADSYEPESGLPSEDMMMVPMEGFEDRILEEEDEEYETEPVQMHKGYLQVCENTLLSEA